MEEQEYELHIEGVAVTRQWDWRFPVAIGFQFLSNVADATSVALGEMADLLSAVILHADEQSSFHEQAAREIETITEG